MKIGGVRIGRCKVHTVDDRINGKGVKVFGKGVKKNVRWKRDVENICTLTVSVEWGRAPVPVKSISTAKSLEDGTYRKREKRCSIFQRVRTHAKQDQRSYDAQKEGVHGYNAVRAVPEVCRRSCRRRRFTVDGNEMNNGVRRDEHED